MKNKSQNRGLSLSLTFTNITKSDPFAGGVQLVSTFKFKKKSANHHNQNLSDAKQVGYKTQKQTIEAYIDLTAKE